MDQACSESANVMLLHYHWKRLDKDWTPEQYINILWPWINIPYTLQPFCCLTTVETTARQAYVSSLSSLEVI